MRQGVLLLLAVCLAVAVAGAHSRASHDLDSPLVDVAESPVEGPPARRLLVVVLDGARTDAVPGVPVLAQLGREGAAAQLEADLPTMSAPQYVSLLSGATPEVSGRRSNEAVGPVMLDSVPGLVRRAGGTTAVYSDCVDWWWRLFPDAFDAHVATTTFAPALELVKKPHHLVVVHLCAFDDAGHAFGAASEPYRAGAALEVQLKVKALLDAWGGAGPVAVTSDHGHTDRGGHGGAEPEVARTFVLLSGPGVTPEGRAQGRAVDVAPTLAALLGVPAPSASEGRTLTALLDVPPEEWRRLEAADAARVPVLEEQARRRRALLEAGAFVARVLRGLSAAAVLLLVAALVRRWRRRALLGLTSGGGALLLSGAGHLLLVGAVSPSAARMFGHQVLTAMALGAVAAALAIVPAALLAARRDGRDAGLAALLAGAAGASPLVLWAYSVFGLAASRPSVGAAWTLILPTLAWSAWAGTLAVLLLAAAVLWRMPAHRAG